MPTILQWYLVHTKPANEAVAQVNLTRQGYGTYLPRLVSSVRRAGVTVERVAPLFPRYFFVRLDEEQQSLAPIRSSVGVACVVRFGSHYAVVADRVINDLRSRAEPESGLHRLSRSPPPAPGSRVRITAGPFDGLEGVFQHSAGADRVIVLLRLLGHDTRVQVPSFELASSHAA